MKLMKCTAAVGAAAVAAMLPCVASAQQRPDAWTFAASIYGYFPSINGTTTFPADSGGTGINISSDKIIDSIKFAFMGSFDMHNGRWGAFTDVMYLDVGGSKSGTRDFSIGNSGIPANTSANLNLDLKGVIWTVAGEYRVVSNPGHTMDVLAGARLLDIKQTLGWEITGDLGPLPPTSRTGNREESENLWDGIVGVKGRLAFGANREWLVPYYLDIGTGQSDLTWQAAGGIGYAFKWGEINLLYRYLDYNMKSGSKIEDVNLRGPMIGATFRW
jgi:hypothetical protein